jgi:death-on-curing protein
MRYLTLGEVLELYHRIIKQSGGAQGIRDLRVRVSIGTAAHDVRQSGTFTLVEKASALGFSLIKNHPFVDGNKRTGHAAMETFLVLNGFEIDAKQKWSRATRLHVPFISRE